MKRPDYLIPYDLMEAAVSGNEECICRILGMYGPYIDKVCKRRVRDKGQTYYIVDPWIKHQVQAKLVSKILDYKITVS